ncbi:SDR family NAD(P)-dependent oxidoreductase [Pseudomonas sp. Teo4]|uniref:SDR family NAD(P)-dependent oxidoreductase n=1 Tax=Pseudomonas sp. Teo4 TaxID=3064528 RepID=UPI002AB8BDF6|nr:SDR family NAD(P)-dependent oxidoreductase [Pseudomonas sp. Teo4]MDZ3992543.1 3-oxoacyl-[acyl-carrier-protein] reductase FabG [Pseudomonas sp. Teo4]
MKNVAIITGAASGIGQATSLVFAKRGYVVVGADRDLAGLEQTAEKIKSIGGVFDYRAVDAANESEVSALVAYTKERFGWVSAVVSCAGVARTGRIDQMPRGDWDLQISVNLTGTYLLAKSAMEVFMEQKGGSFVAVSSDAGVRGASGYAAYCASKHGVIGLVRCLALDYGKFGIRSNAVCPGFVQTQMMDQLFAESANPEEEKLSYMKEIPLGRFAAPEEVGKVIQHLSSEDAGYTNGIIYAIDGGVTAGHFE